ncbi:MAG: HD-GYP domain-containing protein [Coriobacteriia bacterium]|nr:HD-GYP domain-containing protein [Coriobacteriia bacterium]
MTRRYKVYVLAMLCCAGASISWLWSMHRPWLPAGTLISLIAVTILSESLAVRLPKGGSTSLAFASDFAAVVLTGGVPAALVAVAGAVTWEEIREHKSPWIMMFNVSQAVVCSAAAVAVLQILGVEPIAISWPNLVVTPHIAASWALSALAFEATNLLAVTVGISLAYDMPVGQVVRVQRLPIVLFNILVLAPLGVLLALVALKGRWLTGLVLAVPFMLERRVLHAYVRLYESFTETLRLLVSALESKDTYTKGHSERVAKLARAVSVQIGLNSEQVELAERAALLHDLGKITVSSSVLKSSARLGPVELAEIRQHPAIGARLVSQIEFLRDAAPVIAAHHEKMDGSGYPEGLAGDKIPLLARILACVDAYDAMTSTRPYREALSPQVALEEIQRSAGTHLDPRVVEAFCQVIQSFGDEGTDG